VRSIRAAISHILNTTLTRHTHLIARLLNGATRCERNRAFIRLHGLYRNFRQLHQRTYWSAKKCGDCAGYCPETNCYALLRPSDEPYINCLVKC